MSTVPPADIGAAVTAAVSQRLHPVPPGLGPATDLRTLPAFSSFAGVDILERLEEELGVEVPAEEITAERLCSIAALTRLFAEALGTAEVTAP